MKEKFDKYWEQYNKVFEMAILLDPSHKLLYLEYALRKLYGSREDISIRRAEILKLFRNLYKEYCVIYDTPTTILSNVDRVDLAKKPTKFEDEWLVFEEEMTQATVVEEKSELDSNLEEPRDKSISFNILDWWKVNLAKYPVISRMVCDILAIPVSTVASESAFSTGGRVLD